MSRVAKNAAAGSKWNSGSAPLHWRKTSILYDSENNFPRHYHPRSRTLIGIVISTPTWSLHEVLAFHWSTRSCTYRRSHIWSQFSRSSIYRTWHLDTSNLECAFEFWILVIDQTLGQLHCVAMLVAVWQHLAIYYMVVNKFGETGKYLSASAGLLTLSKNWICFLANAEWILGSA